MAVQTTEWIQGASVVICTTSRSASTFMLKDLCKPLVAHLDLKHISMNIGNLPLESDKKEALFKASERNCLIGPVRNQTELEGMDPDRFNFILVTRNIFDASVSRFFHCTQGACEISDEEKNRLIGQGLNACVEEFSTNYANTLTRYLDMLQGRKNWVHLYYEDMVDPGQYRAWLNAFLEPFPAQNEEHRKAIARALFSSTARDHLTVKPEDPKRHDRVKLPGDHLRKVSHEILSKLYSQHGPVLKRLGYQDSLPG